MNKYKSYVKKQEWLTFLAHDVFLVTVSQNTTRTWTSITCVPEMILYYLGNKTKL